jgi:hypothetical protein
MSSKPFDIVEISKLISIFFFEIVGICYFIKFLYGTGTRQSQTVLEVSLSLLIIAVMLYYLVLASKNMENGIHNKI